MLLRKRSRVFVYFFVYVCTVGATFVSLYGSAQ